MLYLKFLNNQGDFDSGKCVRKKWMYVLLIFHFLIMNSVWVHSESIQKATEKEICQSQICKNQAGSIMFNMDTTVNPCEDFYDFACGSYKKYSSRYNTHTWGYGEINDNNVFVKKEEMEKPENTDDPLFVNKVKKYHKSCVNKPSEVDDVVKELLKAIHLPKWPISKDDDARSLIEDAAALSIIYKGSEPLFNIEEELKNSYMEVNIGDTSVQENVLLNKADAKYAKLKEQYLTLIKYVFNELHLPMSDLETLITEIIQFEISLAEIKKLKQNENSTISGLQSTCQQVNWEKVFKHLFEHLGHEEKYSGDFPLKISSVDYINNLCSLIEAAKPRVVYNVLIWNILIPYLARFDFNFRLLLKDMGDNMQYDIHLPMLPAMRSLKWKTCVTDMEVYIKLGLEYMLIKSKRGEDGIKEVENYVEEIRETLDESFATLEWADDHSRNLARQRLKKMGAAVGYEDGSVNLPFLNHIFGKVDITDSYAANLFSVRRAMFSDKIFNISVFSFISNEIKFETSRPDPFIRMRNSEAFIEFPLGLMQPPYYGYKLPHYLNYGRAGYIAAHEIAHAFNYMDYNAVSPEERVLPNEEVFERVFPEEWSQKFLQGYKEKKNCLIKQYSQLPLEDTMVNGTLTVWEDICDNSALDIAFQTYEKYLEKNEKEPLLPGLDFTNRQMFFIGHAQMYCQVVDSIKETFQFSMSTTGKYRVNVPMMNNPGFSKAFDCPASSNMNPGLKCRMWE